jgi:hypothetical protein
MIIVPMVETIGYITARFQRISIKFNTNIKIQFPIQLTYTHGVFFD